MSAKSRALSPTIPAIKTMADLADHVRLSRATVSRILNGHSGIKQKNIDRVMAVVQQTGFTPNPYSNMLRDQRSGTIAVSLSSFRFPIVTQKLSRVAQRLVQAGYTVLTETGENFDHAGIRKWILKIRAEGVIFVGQYQGIGLAEHVRELAATGIPHVFCDDSGIRESNVVTVDRASGMADLTRHLLDLGHRRIGLMGIDTVTPVHRARLRGMSRAIVERGLDPEDVLVHLENPPPRNSNMIFGRDVARIFAAKKDRPTAFAALGDEIAFGAIEGFRAASLRVPGDVSVTGFDNADIGAVSSPSITTVDPAGEKCAELAADFLLSQLGPRARLRAGFTKLIKPEVIVRESSGPVKQPVA
jgi:DNA-binding LacI/PurR family transcriptional regulator